MHCAASKTSVARQCNLNLCRGTARRYLSPDYFRGSDHSTVVQDKEMKERKLHIRLLTSLVAGTKWIAGSSVGFYTIPLNFPSLILLLYLLFSWRLAEELQQYAAPAFADHDIATCIDLSISLVDFLLNVSA